MRYMTARASSLSSVGRLALAGLILSVAVLVVVISVVNGFERELRERLLALLPHVAVSTPNGISEREVERLRDASVKAASYVQGTVLIARGERLVSATATGIDPAEYAQVSDVARFTGAGTLDGLSPDRFEVVLGAELARRLGVVPGEQVRVILPVGGATAAGLIPRQRTFEVSDILLSESQLDGQYAFVHIAIATRLFRTRQPHGVHIRAPDVFDLSPTIDAVYATLGEQARVTSWAQKYGPLYQAIAVQKVTMFVLLSFLVAVAAFNLISGLVMIVEQRKQDVAILGTLGYGQSGILILFLVLGMTIASVGICVGVALGAALAMALPHLFLAANDAFSLNLMSQYFIAYLPVDVRWPDLLVIVATAFGLAALATLFPAMRATRILPGRVLAHE